MRIFTLDVNGLATLCFNAADANEAIGICSLDEFRADLSTLTSGGRTICTARSVLSVRNANDGEIATFKRMADVTATLEAPVFAFLLDIDAYKLDAKSKSTSDDPRCVQRAILKRE